MHRIEPLRSRYLLAAQTGATFFLSSIVLYELQYGVEKSVRVIANRERLVNLIGSDFTLLPFADRDAETAGRIRALLQARKQPIGPYDTLIAGQAVTHGLTLVTANVREFSRVDGLRWEDWS